MENILEGIGGFAGGVIVAAIVVTLVLGFTVATILFLVKNGVIGALILAIASFFGSAIGLNVPITIWTALITGIFGVPGALAVIAYHNLF